MPIRFRAEVMEPGEDFDQTAFDPAKLGNPTLIRQRKERSLRKQAALLGFSFHPANAGAVS